MMASQHDRFEPIEGIDAAKECVEGNRPVKDATMSFQKSSLNDPMVIIR